ncbi:helicase-associated domain-containing protein [Amycolatopsis saalfeldensis]|uniref:Helicase conserved C-terminal domain-containing protein n=1 Tax=Amycolatopsis saalfeldensis TaxID=394193 RepID=A0A1H8WJ22_9PSEU|nr:helicase-associated domain-containing protein [Amycolatopsis saalfeldensis]SEP27513.1 Helicase conserved C-terminal domain-containing protein [Amycolatopsis saalfeldensis]
MPATSLADWLRAESDDALAELLRTRRDLSTPPPSDSTVLATRAGTPGSVARACEDLDTRTLAVLDALLVAGADVVPAPLAEVRALVGADVSDELTRLRARALVWGGDDELRVPPSARDALGPFPAGLGAPSPVLAATDLAARLAEVGDDERAVLAKLAAGPPIGRTRDASFDVSLGEASTPVQKLLARGLLLRRDDQTVELPRELGLRLRGGVAFDPATLTEPELPVHPHRTATVDETAAGEAMEFLRQTEALLRSWSAVPAPVLKAGGLGVRELRKLAKDLDVDEARAMLVAELAVGAGLVADSETTGPEWVPTTLTDSWLASPTVQRWMTLAQAWLELPRLPGLAGGRDAKDKPIAPLSEEPRRPLAPVARRRVLTALAQLPSGAGVKSVDELVAVLAWRAPRRGGRLRDETVRWTMAEATALGLVGLGGLTSAARLLLEDDRPGAVEAMHDALPAPVDHVLVQADLTVVAPGPLEPELAADMAAVADVESAGHATVYRVTETSVRRALDTGRTADELHAMFRAKSATPVPQGLTYLIDDVARRHGRLRGGTAGSFLRCDDEALLAEVLANPVAAEYDLRMIASTVLISSAPLGEVMEGLRSAGFAPAAEGPDGRVVDIRPSGRRLPARARAARARPGEQAVLSEDQASRIVSNLRAGDAASARRRGSSVSAPTGGGADTSATLELLSLATLERREVWIGFVDSRGTASQRVVRPVRVGGGVLEGTDHERYPLHRITSAALVED